MPAPQHKVSEAIRFIIRHVIAWSIVVALGTLALWSIAGFSEKLGRIGWAAGSIAIVVAVGYLIHHMTRVYALAGYFNDEVLGNRHDRHAELPGEAGDGLLMVEATVRAHPYFDSIDIDLQSGTLTARIKVTDSSSGSDRYSLVRARVEVVDGALRAHLRFEPEGNPLWDVLFTDGGRNLENALSITRQLNDRIAERRRADRDAAERTALEKQLAEAQLKLLQAQVEPHFLYNTLANAQLLTRSDPQRADAMLGHLIEFLRSSLPAGRAEHSTLGVELDRSRAYLEILRIRMGDRLRVEVEVPDALRATPLPPLMLQTLVENAIKHGLEPKRGGGTLWISAVRKDDSVILTVADDGVGFQEGTAGTGVGLVNLRERLALAFGERASLSLSVNYPSGVAAVLRLPA